MGDLLQGAALNYFSLNDQQDSIAAEANNIITYRLPSYGIVATSLNTQYWFGIARNVSFTGINFDIDHMKAHHVAKNNVDAEKITRKSYKP